MSNSSYPFTPAFIPDEGVWVIKNAVTGNYMTDGNQRNQRDYNRYKTQVGAAHAAFRFRDMYYAVAEVIAANTTAEGKEE